VFVQQLDMVVKLFDYTIKGNLMLVFSVFVELERVLYVVHTNGDIEMGRFLLHIY